MMTTRMTRYALGIALALALSGVPLATSTAIAQDPASGAVTIEVIAPGTPGTPAAFGALLDPVTGLSTIATFGPDQWTGAAMVSETESYGRIAAALYAQSTGTGTASLNIGLSDPSTEDVILTLVGMDDDAATKTPIELTINTTVVYQGDAWFEDWGGKVGEGNWTTVQVTIPKGMLGPGVNSITLSNTAAAGNEGETPYVLLGGASIQVTGVTVDPIDQS